MGVDFKVTWDYFCQELIAFREIIGLKNYTLEQWNNAWGGLLYVYILLQEKTDKALNAIEAVQIDYERRVQFRLGLGYKNGC